MTARRAPTSLLKPSAISWPEVWRPIDRLLAQWVLAHGGSEGFARWAGAVSAAEGEGHAALALDDVARFGVDAPTHAALDAPHWVGDGTTMTPFVREGEARLFLWRYWQAENAVARAVATLATTTAEAPFERLGDTELDALFDSAADARDTAQREAVCRCGEARLFVLTGGPGTGKTTTVLRMLLARQRALGRPLRVAVAAPTGKAAQRLVDALREGHSRLGETLVAGPWAEALQQFVMPSASTVHRLLGYQPTRQRYARDAHHPIDAELVVIDEASMLDLEALAAVLEALPAHAALWLVGDADQLSPIGPGSALQDLVQALAARPAAPLVRLAHSFRAEAGLAALNTALRIGDSPSTHAAFAAHATLRHAPLATAAALDSALREWAIALAAESRFAALTADPATAQAEASAALARLRERQWLCATREGATGSRAVNARLDALLRRAGERTEAAFERQPSPTAGSGHYAGRRLLITRNDTDIGLFNGDVGLCLADADGRLRAWFDGPEGARALPLGALPTHEPAFALTVHKSQGSEYAEVAVLLPADPAQRVLTRELLYTAASRAKRSLTLHADTAVIKACLARPACRSGGLHVRLDEALGAPPHRESSAI